MIQKTDENNINEPSFTATVLDRKPHKIWELNF